MIKLHCGTASDLYKEGNMYDAGEDIVCSIKCWSILFADYMLFNNVRAEAFL